MLTALVTDSWLSRSAARVLRPWLPSLAGRRRDDIPDQLVKQRTLQRIILDLRLRRQMAPMWSAAMQRNDWFGGWATSEVEKLSVRTVFSYSYTARLPFRLAKQRAMLCILDQIDGAWREEQVWRELSSPYHHLEAEVDQAPQRYWETWREELEMADVIMVNSDWSRRLIIEAGAEEAKITVVPLVYETRAGQQEKTSRSLGPPRARLQVLFLGNVVLRKGVGQLFDAMRLLRNEPIDFTFAGPMGVQVPGDIAQWDHVRFLGPVARAVALDLYRKADVFLFPTLSDGFGRTQLEALSEGCPVIASKHCGEVVEHKVNGLLLEEITPECIAESVMLLRRDASLLANLASAACVPERFHPRHLSAALSKLTKVKPH